MSEVPVDQTRAQTEARTGCGLHAAVRRYISDRRGGVALIFGLVSVLMFACVGGAIDFAYAFRAQALMQSTMDAAILAAARAKQTGASDVEAIAAANNYMKTARTHLPLSGAYSFEVKNSGTGVAGTAELGFPTSFLHVVGLDKLVFAVGGEASFGNGSASQTNVELVMMLDVTGSMRGQKITDLKVAVEDLIGIVVADDQSVGRSRIGLAPFSASVRLDNQAFRAATGKDNSAGGYEGCVVERVGPEAMTDARPVAGSFVVPLEDVAPWWPCRDNRDIVPLTDKKSHLKEAVRKLEADGFTAGQIGTAWAWYLLSEHWGELFAGDNRPAPYGDLWKTTSSGEKKLRKIAVLMTDGEYNTAFNGKDPVNQAKTLCANMKATGIEVFTVGFGMDEGSETEAMLKVCASDPSKFYRATTGDDLRFAFRDIALQATPLRLVK